MQQTLPRYAADILSPRRNLTLEMRLEELRDAYVQVQQVDFSHSMINHALSRGFPNRILGIYDPTLETYTSINGFEFLVSEEGSSTQEPIMPATFQIYDAKNERLLQYEMEVRNLQYVRIHGRFVKLHRKK